MPLLAVPMRSDPALEGKTSSMKVWGTGGTAYEVSSQASKWFSDFINGRWRPPLRTSSAPCVAPLLSQFSLLNPNQTLTPFPPCCPRSPLPPADLLDAGATPLTPDTPAQPQNYRLLRMVRPRVPSESAGREKWVHKSDVIPWSDTAQVLCANGASLTAVNNGLKDTFVASAKSAVAASGSSSSAVAAVMAGAASAFTPVAMEQFRPNIIVEGAGAGAWDEDSWGILEGPGVILRRNAICQRCVMTTVALDGRAHPQTQPLAWLKRHRLPVQHLPPAVAKTYKDVPMFGTYFNLHRQQGGAPKTHVGVPRVAISDTLTVTLRSYLPVL